MHCEGDGTARILLILLACHTCVDGASQGHAGKFNNWHLLYHWGNVLVNEGLHPPICCCNYTSSDVSMVQIDTQAGDKAGQSCAEQSSSHPGTDREEPGIEEAARGGSSGSPEVQACVCSLRQKQWICQPTLHAKVGTNNSLRPGNGKEAIKLV